MTVKDAFKIRNPDKSKVPWFMHRNRCDVCTGYHAPWWRHGQAPSCQDGDRKVNDLVMFLEYQKATGRTAR